MRERDRRKKFLCCAIDLAKAPSIALMKTQNGCLQSSKHEERKTNPEFYAEKADKRERSVKPKEKREKLSEEEKEIRKERKMGRKRVCTQGFVFIYYFDSILKRFTIIIVTL